MGRCLAKSHHVKSHRGIEPWAGYFSRGLHRRAARDHAWIEQHFAALADGCLAALAGG